MTARLGAICEMGSLDPDFAVTKEHSLISSVKYRARTKQVFKSLTEKARLLFQNNTKTGMVPDLTLARAFLSIKCCYRYHKHTCQTR